jgi:hypothetical protein
MSNHNNLRGVHFWSPPRDHRPAHPSVDPILNFEALAVTNYPRFTEDDIFDKRDETDWLYLRPAGIRGSRAPWNRAYSGCNPQIAQRASQFHSSLHQIHLS